MADHEPLQVRVVPRPVAPQHAQQAAAREAAGGQALVVVVELAAGALVLRQLVEAVLRAEDKFIFYISLFLYILQCDAAALDEQTVETLIFVTEKSNQSTKRSRTTYSRM